MRDPQTPGSALASEGVAGPLFRQVKLELVRRIEAGEWAPGAALPSELQLSQRWGVSIGTVRRAVDELVEEHVLLRRQGKGTFVRTHGQERFLFQFFHVAPRGDWPQRAAPKSDEYPRVQCVAFAREIADETVAGALSIRPGAAVLVIDNVLSLAGAPVVHDRLILAAALFRGLTERRFVERPSTIYDLYQLEYGITVLRAHERARACAASRVAARWLNLPQGTPLLEVHRIALSFGDKPVEYRISTINTRLYDYVNETARAANRH